MKGDFSRFTFLSKKHYVKVNMQQERVQLDADWNEQNEIHNYRDRISLQEIIGESGTAVQNDGFGIECHGSGYTIKRGHYYVNGILCENENDLEPNEQPDLPSFNYHYSTLPTSPGKYLVYLDVWERHLTYLDDPQIREVSLGGPDTATRTKVVWQVKVVRVADIENEMDCYGPFKDWKEIINPSTGTLQARCKLGGGYTGFEHALYRIEVHDPGNLDQATFKWSRFNGAIVTKLIDISGQKLSIDKPLALTNGQWVEIIDDRHELWGKPGTLIKLATVEENKITFYADSVKGDPLTVENYPKELNPKVRKWDSDGPVKVQIPPDNNGYIPLEDGVEIKFEPGSYHAGDYWFIPSRTSTKDIEWPQTEGLPAALPPTGIKHTYAPLALIQYDNDTTTKLLSDCRQFFSSSTFLTTQLRAHSGVWSAFVEGGTFKIIGPIYHNVSGTTPPAIIVGETDASQADKEDTQDSKSVNVGTNTVRYTEDLTLFSVLNTRYGFAPKEDPQNPPGLAAQLGLDGYLNTNESSPFPIFFKAVSIDPQKFHILLVNYDKSRARQLINLRWWAIPLASK
ncbi:MAG: DUF6519 domain-containing protein [Thermoproteota archaeon]|nr:DUF6519 domain-containing protein [Thermoproteota archaeon]